MGRLCTHAALLLAAAVLGGHGAVTPAVDALQTVVTNVVTRHCPTADQLKIQEQRIVSNLRATFEELLEQRFPTSKKGRLYRCGCPEGFIPCGGGCYARLDAAVEYSRAETQCAQLGGHLAVPRSREQNLCVAGLAANAQIWIGVTDRDEEGVYMGADGRPVTGTEGHVWSNGQPDNAGNNEHCVEIWKSGRFAEWNDRPCNFKNIPMCQLG